MSEPQSAVGSAVRGHASDAMRSAILDEIRDASFDRMAEAGGTLALISRAASSVASVMSVYGEISNIFEMAVSVIGAYTIPRRRVERVAAAHAFGYWVVQGPGMYPPTEMPIGFQREMFTSDAQDRDVGQRIGNLDNSRDGLSAADWQTIWSSSARSTISGLERGLVRKAERGVLQPALREATDGNAAVAGQSDSVIAQQYRVIVIGAGFRHDPVLAARSFLLGSLNEEDSHHARSAIIEFYTRFPYYPAQR